MATKKKNESPFLNYKGKPLVRKGNTLYYGFPNEKFVTMLQILSTEKVDNEEMSKDISVTLISTDENLPMTDRIIKTTEKKGLYPALHIANIWLELALSEEEEKNSAEEKTAK